MKPTAPPRVSDEEPRRYTPPTDPAQPSRRVLWWIRRIREEGWRPNRRLQGLSCDAIAAYYGIAHWEVELLTEAIRRAQLYDFARATILNAMANTHPPGSKWSADPDPSDREPPPWVMTPNRLEAMARLAVRAASDALRTATDDDRQDVVASILAGIECEVQGQRTRGIDELRAALHRGR